MGRAINALYARTTGCTVRRGTLIRTLSSPRLALFVLLVLGVYIGSASWLPWTLDNGVKAPGWALATGLGRPFSSAPFLILVFLLLVNTIACTWERTSRARALYAGKIPAGGQVLSYEADSAFIDFLKHRGFRTYGRPPYFMNRFALTRGWLFHVGLVVLIAGILVQQAWHEDGSFEIAEREMVSLSDPGVVFNRRTGIFAPVALPALELALVQFDPYLRQKGYAPDRASTLVIRTKVREQQVVVDRANGVSIEGVSVYQAIPFGIALNLQIADAGLHSLHLKQQSPTLAIGEFKDPSGRAVRFSVQAERDLNDPLGSGSLRFFIEQDGATKKLAEGQPFMFGGLPARIVSVARWAGFTYSRSPGVSVVFAGFFLLLAGTGVMLLPAGIAAREGADMPRTFRIYLTQGARDFAEDWARFQKSCGQKADSAPEYCPGLEERNQW